jgi:hypothetical protein
MRRRLTAKYCVQRHYGWGVADGLVTVAAVEKTLVTATGRGGGVKHLRGLVAWRLTEKPGHYRF